MDKTVEKVGMSRFWSLLWAKYTLAPSVALCRIPELEYAATLDVTGRVLDHCCGDGMFASLAWPDSRVSAGCDVNTNSIAAANSLGIYSRLDCCDASKRLPYEDDAFDLVFNNSALEHIKDVDAALFEVSRVLAGGGFFVFNVLNHRYFEWWPLDEESKNGYKRWQPFYHALNLEEWTERLARVGLQVTSVQGYFDQVAAQELARLDFTFSGAYLANRPSLGVLCYRFFPPLMKKYWQRRLGELTWKTQADAGAGYFIKAVRSNP
jgi:SAM-dependent methyltransferase